MVIQYRHTQTEAYRLLTLFHKGGYDKYIKREAVLFIDINILCGLNLDNLLQ